MTALPSLLRRFYLVFALAAALASATVLEAATISGNVYEDVGYPGGAGRSKAASSGVNRSGARVELYLASGSFQSVTTTDADGNYSFSLGNNATYIVRVVNSTVTSSLGGTSLLPVQTWRSTATSGSAVAVTDRVGGEDPAKADAGNGSTTLAALTTGSLTPQSITSVTVGSSDIGSLNFGFNFNTIVNTANTGQGSLRQLITNANAMTGTQTSVFMISDGAAHPGLRSALDSQLTGGVAVIALASALPQITGAFVLDGTSQTTNVGNTNSGTLGAGGTVGVDGLTLSTVNRPEVEIVGTSSITFGLDIAAASSTVKGLAIHGCGTTAAHSDINIGGVSGVTVTQCVVGATATSFSLPVSAATGGNAIRVATVTSATFSNNLIGFAGYDGILFTSANASGCTIQNNEIRGCGTVNQGYSGADPAGSSHTISGNLFIAHKGQGLDFYSTSGGSNSVVNNTITGNGVGTASTTESPGLRVQNSNNTFDRNRIYANYGAGISVSSGATGNKITRNSIYGNGTILNAAGATATGQVGIDLLNASDNVLLGTAPYYTLNDSGDGDAGGNNLLNFPVLETATVAASNLIVAGWARPGSVIELFIANADPSGFGEGQTYLTSLTEGGSSDTDSGSSSYSGSINGISQGSDTTNRFRFTFALPAGVTNGTALTATATDTSNNTSEFSGQVVANVVTLAGTVYEDVNYTGGAGRTKVASSGVGRSGARVELYVASGSFAAATTTDSNGAWSFEVSPGASHTVRVVNGTVTSSLAGASLLPVQTYLTTGTSGAAVGVTDRVGGEDPTKADAGNGSTTLAALTTSTTTPQSIASATVGSSSIAGLDFGFNFNTVVNKNDAGQGSLRQFIANANAMTGTQTSVFMISNGTAKPGLRAGLTNQLTAGVAIVTLASALPQITGTLVLDGASQTTNVGNTNSTALGTGGTVGVDGLTLSTVNRPEVEIVGLSSITAGLDVAAANSTVKGIAIHGCGTLREHADIAIGAVNGVTIAECLIGLDAKNFALPTVNYTRGSGVVIAGGTGGTITNNLIGFVEQGGIRFGGDGSGWQFTNNEIRGAGLADAVRDGLTLRGAGHTISGNLFASNKGQAFELVTSTTTSVTVVNNTITDNGRGVLGTIETPGIRIYGPNNTFDRNKIYANYGAGIAIRSSMAGNRITRNAIYANGTVTNDSGGAATGAIGIDLLSASDNAATGTAPYYTLNDSGDGDAGGNNLLNTPVIDTATIVGSNLEITGWVGAAGATIEFFVADNDASGFGEGETFVASFVEGSGSDTDATTSGYSGNVNCFAQGSDANVARFKFTFAKPGSVSVGAKLTATATDASNNTSEFSGNVTVYDNFPGFSVVKSLQTISDPVNATANPKAIPGGVVLYTIAMANSAPARGDTGTFAITDPVPANTKLYVGDIGGAGSGPVAFVDGATSSTFAYTFTSLANASDSLSFSNNNGSTWTYVPTPDADGCDANVTDIRIVPGGAFAKATCGNTPSFTVQFRVRVR